jgi:hypothetical protein
MALCIDGAPDQHLGLLGFQLHQPTLPPALTAAAHHHAVVQQLLINVLLFYWCAA